MAAHNVIVIGASAGGLEAIQSLVATLPGDLPAAVFVTVHVYERSNGIVPELLNRVSPLPAAHAVDGETIRTGRIYVAPPDHHLRLAAGHVHVSHGPKENMQRPCINVMFRSAARSYGERVAGVLLTGMLDDGVAGLGEIQQNHGATIVQDPEEAAFRSMPDSAIHGLNVQYIVRLAEMGPLLTRLSVADQKPSRAGEPVLPNEELSAQVCPECGGAMTTVRMGGLREYRCHIGHRFGLQTLIAEKRKVVERALETALSQSEELASLLDRALNERSSESSESVRSEIARLKGQQETLRSLAGDKDESAAH
ncbi:MAG: chemotaxis protein CheB [Acidobacteriota bacterium]